MILILLDFLSGMEWLCQPDRNVEPKKPFVADNEKAGSRYFHLKSGFSNSGFILAITASQKRYIFNLYSVYFR